MFRFVYSSLRVQLGKIREGSFCQRLVHNVSVSLVHSLLSNQPVNSMEQSPLAEKHILYWR